MKLTYIQIGLYVSVFLILFGTWGALLQWGRGGADQAAYIGYIHDTLLALVAHILTIVNPATEAPPTVPPVL